MGNFLRVGEKWKVAVLTFAGVLTVIAGVVFLPEIVYVERSEPGIFLEEFVDDFEFAGQDLKVFIADEYDERVRGLSGTEVLPYGYAMLFDFGGAGNYGIWMKGMNYSLDVVWLDENFEILSAVENMSPDSYPRVFYGGDGARYVLELPAGWLRKYGVIGGEE